MNRKLITIFTIVIVLLGIGTYVGWLYYQSIFGENIRENENSIVYIYPGSIEDSIRTKIEPFLLNKKSFERAQKVLDFEFTNTKPGRYNFGGISTNRELINTLRSGNVEPVNVIIYNENSLGELAGKLSKYLLMDSLELKTCIQQSDLLNENGFAGDSLFTLFIPNTYQMYWMTNCEALSKRLIKEHNTFWESNDRLQKAKRLGMTPHEIYTLATIVDRETLAAREKPIVAKLYLNRLEKGMLLQADPTVVFANQLQGARRVLYKHLEIDSPYNTYKYPGLPPGPIGIASISGIDAVLNHDEHSYLYMCSKPDNSGLHNFATNIREHNINAAAYRRWLNQRGIR
ncbi:endolytic transglycosylase MltG [Membranihabitans maritimus]|uniref:endolytic transglycosylase MltG n=1 Tax=Membranihabitans maritimus TaxID=2904244 RepID=UPI001F023165|nr:endolytic transglycosylase MltG [Membranihabitans maritimus]